jgi:hypothetical protein
MPQFTSQLDHVKIGAPCSADWDQMFSFENNRVRFCSQCNLNVYNLSGMRKEEAEALIIKTEGRLCVRFYRRADGTILTQNCPEGLKAIKRRVAWIAQAVLGMVLSFVSGLGLYIFHLGRKPLPDFDTFRLPKPPVSIGAIAVRPEPKLPPDPGPPQIGKVLLGRVRIEPRRNAQIPQNEAQRPARRFRQ